MHLSTRVAVLFGAVAVALAAGPALAWWGDGHAIVARAAVAAQPQEVPAFFRAGGQTVAHVSCDPDLAKNRATPHVAHAEHPEHFVDLERLAGQPLPEQRYDFIVLCQKLKVDPVRVGFGAYAVTEWTERLAVAFAEHRQWPEDLAIQGKCLVYAGLLAHYAGDLMQPLHTTIHYDGRAGADGRSPHTGIHEQVDSIIERLQLDPHLLAVQVGAAPMEGNLFEAVRAAIAESHGRVDRVYELEGQLDPVSDEARAFALERARRATAFTASLYLTAWKMSEGIELPGWLRR